MFRFVRSETLTNDLEAIVISGACEIDGYVVINVNTTEDELGPLVACVWIK